MLASKRGSRSAVLLCCAVPPPSRAWVGGGKSAGQNSAQHPPNARRWWLTPAVSAWRRGPKVADGVQERPGARCDLCTAVDGVLQVEHQGSHIRLFPDGADRGELGHHLRVPVILFVPHGRSTPQYHSTPRAPCAPAVRIRANWQVACSSWQRLFHPTSQDLNRSRQTRLAEEASN